MMKPVLVVAPFLMLAACISPEQQAAMQQRATEQRIEQCRALGAVTQQQIFQCQMALHQQQIAQQEAQAAMWRGVGQALLTPQPQQPVHRPVTCNSQRVGNNVYTSCF